MMRLSGNNSARRPARTTWVWAALVLATVLSWGLGHAPGPGRHPVQVTAAVLLIAWLKVRCVFLDFMELRRAPLPLRLAVEAWALLVCGAVAVLYGSGLAHYPTNP